MKRSSSCSVFEHVFSSWIFDTVETMVLDSFCSAPDPTSLQLMQMCDRFALQLNSVQLILRYRFFSAVVTPVRVEPFPFPQLICMQCRLFLRRTVVFEMCAVLFAVVRRTRLHIAFFRFRRSAPVSRSEGEVIFQIRDLKLAGLLRNPLN